MLLTRRVLSFICALSIALITTLYAGAPLPAYALGLSPPTVVIDALLRDTTQERTVYISRAPNEVGNIYVSVVPDSANEQFFVLEKTDFVLHEGQPQVPYTFEVTPGAAANGSYTLKLRFLKVADPTQIKSGSGVAVVSGVTAQIEVTVGGEEHLSYSLGSLSVEETEVGLDVPLVFSVNNDGNVDWQPTKIVFAFFSEAGEQVDVQELNGSEIEAVKAGQLNQNFRVRVPANLTQGRYTATASFYDKDQLVQTLMGNGPFDVYPEGTLDQSGKLLGLSVNKELFHPSEQVKVTGIFKNTGTTDIKATLVLEISRNDEILDYIRGREIGVDPGDEHEFSEFFTPEKEGEYKVTAHIEYGSKETDNSYAQFKVATPFNFLNSPWLLGGVAVLLIVGALVFLKIRKRFHASASTADLRTEMKANRPPEFSPSEILSQTNIAPTSNTLTSTSQVVENKTEDQHEPAEGS